MGFRFRKSIKILPGVRINLSKSGVSTTVGVPGANINISERGTRGTVGLPGSGISYTEQIDPGRRLMNPEGRGGGAGWVIVVMVIGAVLVWLVK